MYTHEVCEVGAQEVLIEIDNYVRGNRVNQQPKVPHVVHLPLFRSRKLRARIVNKITSLPLRIVRKSTMDYWSAQKQVDFKQTIDIENLRVQLLEARQEIEALKKRIK